MCGIVGIVGPASAERHDSIRRMSAAIVHRGPDEDGLYEEDAAALAMRRLAIVDVMEGHQPVFDEAQQIIVVFNGEIYNSPELRRSLASKGHSFRSMSDSECIPHLYEEYGPDFVDHLRGMFAIAIWDIPNQRLVLARDRLGKKPLYYRPTSDGGLRFGSELKALLADPSLERRVDDVAISHYLTYQYVPAPHSAIDGVFKLPPAHVLVHERGNTRVSKYWALDYADRSVSPTAFDEEQVVGELRERLLDCVKIRLVGERPLGAFLSGGLDSSAVVAAMTQVAPGRVKTFSIGFDEESHNELPFARQVADRFGTDHHELVVRPDVLDILPRLATAFDEPYADSSAIPSYYLAEMARQNVVVALNGDGGDELLGGYARYQRYLQVSPRALPSWAARSLFWSGNKLRPLGARSMFLRKASTAAILMADADPARRYARFLSYFRPEEKQAIFTPGFAERVAQFDSYDLVEAIWDAHAGTDDVNRLLAVDTYTYLPGDLLPKVDITTMAVSLEARSPFLDHTLMEWAAGLPGGLKMKGGTSKYLLKRALEGWIEPELIHRKKMGFGIPLAAWLRGPLKPMAHDLLTDRTATGRGYFDRAAVDALLSAHMAGEDHSSRIYALMMLELWHREVLEAQLRIAT